MSLNSVNIMGNLTRDPELKSTPSGKNVCKISIANNRIYVKNGEKVTEVSYFDIDVWGTVADNCARYLKKGSGIIVEGRLRQDRWEKEGKTQSRVSITANNIHFMPKRSDDGAASRARSESDVAAQAPAVDDIAWEE